VIGDWNAIVGMDNVGREQLMRTHGVMVMGSELIEENDFWNFIKKMTCLSLTPDFCKRIAGSGHGWQAPEGKQTNMIDVVRGDRR